MRLLAFLLGSLLLIGAIATVVGRRDTIADALHAIGGHSSADRARLIGIMLASVLANIVLTGAMFSLLMSRYGRVGRLEMQALIAGATLLNYLPLRPGVLGRVAYHKTVNGIAVRDSAKALVQAVLLSAAASAYLTLVVLVSRQRPLAPWIVTSAPLALLPLAGILSRGSARVLCIAGAVRLLDVLVTAVRYHAAFTLIGAPIDFNGALAFACISVIAAMVPLVSNGLGLREWAVGLLAPAIASYHMELGITADLVNRAAELTVVTLVGLPATLCLAKHARARSARTLRV